MVSLVSQSYSKKLLRLISWSHWFTFFNICAAILLSSIYLFADSAPITTFGQVYLVANWFGHMAFLTFMSFVLIVFPITLLFPSTRFIRSYASVIFTIGLVLLVLDGFTYGALGYHLNASSSEQILELISNQIAKDPKGFWLSIIIVSSLILIFELVVSNYAWKHIHRLQQTVFAKYTMVTLVAAFTFSHVSHIWADANLEYDVLQQDTIFPLSYPATAKTLLTKYGLFNESAYIENLNTPLSFNTNKTTYPVLEQCIDNNQAPLERASFMVLNKNSLTEQQVQQFSLRASSQQLNLAHYVDDANNQNAWFNLFYSLPTLYTDNVLAQKTPPVLFQLLDDKGLAKTLTVISDTTAAKTTENNVPLWFNNLFNDVSELPNVATLVFGEYIKTAKPGLHVIYFNNDDDYQLNIFVDALLLAQQKQQTKDIVWVSSLGNANEQTQFDEKSTLFIWPNSKVNKVRVLTNAMDIMPTLVKHWLKCDLPFASYSTASDLFTLKKNRVLANSSNKGMMIFDKDKSVLVDQAGNFNGYSRRLNAPITLKFDYPLMINGMHYIKQFSQYHQKKANATLK